MYIIRSDTIWYALQLVHIYQTECCCVGSGTHLVKVLQVFAVELLHCLLELLGLLDEACGVVETGLDAAQLHLEVMHLHCTCVCTHIERIRERIRTHTERIRERERRRRRRQ